MIGDLAQPRDERERAVTALRSDAARGIPEALFTFGRAYANSGVSAKWIMQKRSSSIPRARSSRTRRDCFAAARLAKLGRVPNVSVQEADMVVRQALVGMFQELGRGSCAVLMQIGAVYASGEIGPRNEALAARWYQAALNAGFVKAAEILASITAPGSASSNRQASTSSISPAPRKRDCRAPCCSSGAFTCRASCFRRIARKRRCGSMEPCAAGVSTG